MLPSVSVKVWGEFALFTRPELKVERLTYPIMTPSAARGILDAILYKPQMVWHIRRIAALRPKFPHGFPSEAAEKHCRFIQVRRNEITSTISPRTVEGWIKEPRTFSPYLVDSAGRKDVQGAHRTQRNSLLLHHVAYRIDAHPGLTSKAKQSRTRPEDEDDRGPDTVAKYVGMFQRRVAKGQCFHRPYLGCREFTCQFALPTKADEPLADWNLELGLMLYDIRFGPNGRNRPGFFQARVTKGVLHCDIEASGPNGEPPVEVFGWDEGGER
jgi:CRISPR-associated protein Cas5d